MKRDNWKVEDYGIRPAGSPDKCFYCNEPKGNTHKKECVIRQRTIVMKMEVDLVLLVPEDWDKEMCEFHKNESSWCADNILPILEKVAEDRGCLCSSTEFKYLREATEQDEDLYNVHVKDVPS